MTSDSNEPKASSQYGSLIISEAEKYGVSPARAQVWEAMSETFLDIGLSVDELDRLAETIAETSFCLHELGHILFREVGPVCFSNTLWWVGGESMGFGLDWLIPKCLQQQKKHRYAASAKPDELSLWMHLASPLYLEAYLLIYRVKRLRISRSQTV